MENVLCAHCGEDHSSRLIQARDFEKPTQEKFTLVRCDRCCLVYQNPRPTREELPKYYSNEEYYSYIELENKESGKGGLFERLRRFLFEKTIRFYYGGERSLPNRFFSWIGKGRFGAAPHDLKKGKILDIGCGDGVFLDMARRCGWEPHGVEINSDAAARAGKAGLNVHAGDLISAGYPEGTFQVVRMWSVLEHVPNPAEVLKEIHQILKPGGYLILQVPNIDSVSYRMFKQYWTGLDLPRHLTHFSPQSLKQFLESSHFEVKKIRSASVGTGFASYKYRQKSKRNGHPGTGRFDRALDPLLRISNIVIDRFCDVAGKGDCMYVWARKKIR